VPAQRFAKVQRMMLLAWARVLALAVLGLACAVAGAHSRL